MSQPDYQHEWMRQWRRAAVALAEVRLRELAEISDATAFADRPQDWLDIDGIVARQCATLNLQQIWAEVEPLVELKEEPAILDRLRTRL